MRKFCLIFLLLILAVPAEARYIRLSWDSVVGATEYRLEWGPMSGGTYTYSMTAIPVNSSDPEWQNTTDYVVGDIVYSPQNHLYYVCTQDHTSLTNPTDVTGAFDGPYIGYITETLTTPNFPINEEDTYMVITAYDGSESIDSTELYISTLQQDGGITPEQIAVFLPGDFPYTMTATMRYKKLGDESWTIGHDLYHLDAGETTDPGFAWTIFDLDQGSTYVVEVTTHDGGEDIVYMTNMTTRTLPDAAGTVTKTITAGSSTAEINAILATAVAGDVLQFENGTYAATEGTGITLTSRNGTEDEPIYIRGESRDGVVLSDTTGYVFWIDRSQHFVIENLTIQGSGTDYGCSGFNGTTGIYLTLLSTQPNKENITIRNTTITGVDQGIVVSAKAKQLLIYENILQGNNTWDQDLWGLINGCTGGPDGIPDIDGNQSSMWDDEGIVIGGYANVAFNNTIDGFGDAFNLGSSNGNFVDIANHVYRNKITMTGDDSVEGDHGERNLSFYDNYVSNVGTLASAQIVHHGPFFVFRNIAINVARSTIFKLNGAQHGIFMYSSTIVRTANPDTAIAGDRDWVWVQYNNGKTENTAFQNNIMIRQNYTGGKTLAYESADEPVDFTHNSWHPDGLFNWTHTDGSESSLAAAYAGLSPMTNIFSTEKRHTSDVIEDAQPFETAVSLPTNAHIEVTTMYTPILSATAKSKNTGVVIAGITDGFTGVAPDRGAIITGRPLVTYGATLEVALTTTPICAGSTPITVQ